MKNDETLFNLFIIEFWISHYDVFLGEKFNVGDIESELFYNSMTLTPNFLAVKSCFPENEYCEVFSGNMYCNFNYIKESDL